MAIGQFMPMEPTFDPPDIHFSNVNCLAHFDVGLPFVDSGPLGRTIAINTSVSIDTSQFVFGGASARLSGGYMVFAGTGPALSGDFTVEGWYRMTSVADCTMWDFRSTGSNWEPTLWVYGGVMRFTIGNSLRLSVGSVGVNTWYHMAVTRAGGSVRMFLDGVQQGSTFTYTSSLSGFVNRPTIGCNFNAASRLNGWVDDMRVTVGVARYTSDFTPPTRPHPDR